MVHKILKVVPDNFISSIMKYDILEYKNKCDNITIKLQEHDRTHDYFISLYEDENCDVVIKFNKRTIKLDCIEMESIRVLIQCLDAITEQGKAQTLTLYTEEIIEKKLGC